MIRLVGKRGKGSFESQLDDAAKGLEFVQIDCTSESPDPALARPSDLAWYFNAGSLADAKGTIPGWAATDRPDIVRLWVPKTVLSIGSFAFKGCVNLEEIVFEASPDGADQLIGTMAFAKCPKLEKVLLSSSVRSIGDGVFRDDGALTTLQIDPIRQQIHVGAHAFDNCPAQDERHAAQDADFGGRQERALRAPPLFYGGT